MRIAARDQVDQGEQRRRRRAAASGDAGRSPAGIAGATAAAHRHRRRNRDRRADVGPEASGGEDDRRDADGEEDERGEPGVLPSSRAGERAPRRSRRGTSDARDRLDLVPDPEEARPAESGSGRAARAGSVPVPGDQIDRVRDHRDRSRRSPAPANRGGAERSAPPAPAPRPRRSGARRAASGSIAAVSKSRQRQIGAGQSEQPNATPGAAADGRRGRRARAITTQAEDVLADHRSPPRVRRPAGGRRGRSTRETSRSPSARIGSPFISLGTSRAESLEDRRGDVRRRARRPPVRVVSEVEVPIEARPPDRDR